MNCEIPILDDQEAIAAGAVVTIAGVTAQWLVIEVENADGSFTTWHIPRKRIGSA